MARRRATHLLATLGLVATAAVFAVLIRDGRPDPPAGTPRPNAVASNRALMLPNASGSVRFAVMGDVGRGDALQHDTADEMARWHDRFPFEFVLMLGDNIYGTGTPEDFSTRFEQPYRALLDREVTFHAAIGNHDPASVLTYPPFGMNGRRYYSFTVTHGIPLKRTSVEFFALDTVTLDAAQLSWLTDALRASKADWQVAFYHHPLYTSGQYRWRAWQTRRQLEPLFVAGGLDVGFSGHEHFYERVVPQQGVQYFTSGAGGALRRGDIRPSSVLAAGFDRDTHFMLVEVADDAMQFQVISRTGDTVDYGTIPRRAEERTPPSLRP